VIQIFYRIFTSLLNPAQDPKKPGHTTLNARLFGLISPLPPPEKGGKR
jgi:hypothetical protein